MDHVLIYKTCLREILPQKSGKPAAIEVDLHDLSLDGNCKIVNLWTGEEVGEYSDGFLQVLSPHACG